MKTCETVGCQQRAADCLDVCFFHHKVEEGLLEETGSYLSESEVNALFRRRRKGDGRRLDQWEL